MRFRGTYRGRAVLLCMAVSCAACASARPVLPPPVVERPSDADVDAFATLLRLEDTRAPDRLLLEGFATSPTTAVRRRTALALGRFGAPYSRTLLRSLLSDPDTGVAATAAFALGEIADSGAVPSLVSILEAPHETRPSVAAEAASALGMIGSDSAIAALRSYLASERVGTNDAVVVSALLAVWRSPGPPEIATPARWVHSRSPGIRWAAAYALARRAGPAAVPALLRLSGDPDPAIRATALRGLTAALVDSAGVSRDSATARLLALVREADYSTRINAVRALGSYSTPAATDTLRSLARADADPHLVPTALESLGRQGSSAAAAAPDLEALALSSRAAEFHRQVALESLARVRPASALSVARRLSDHPSARMRAAAARALAANLPGARAELERLLTDPNAVVVAAALQAAVDAAEDSLAPLRPLLLAQLGARDFGVRTTALTALGRLLDPSTIPLLLDAYGVAQADSSNDAALAALGALGALRDQGTFAGRAFFARFRRSPDYLVRRRAVELFGEAATAAWGPAMPVDSVASPADYRPLAEIQLGLRPPPPDLVIRTDAGAVRVRLFDRDAPLTARNFRMLADRGYFDGQTWPRVVPNFVVQGGDPRGDTNGGPGYTIRDEINRHRYRTGTLGMALSGPDTGGSQFFITHSPQPHLDGIYTVFGEVVEGQAVVERILPGDTIHSVRAIQ